MELVGWVFNPTIIFKSDFSEWLLCKYNSHFGDYANSMRNKMSRKSHFSSDLKL